MKPVVGIDCDGILSNFTHDFTKLANGIHGSPIIFDREIDTWLSGQTYGLSKKEFSQIWDAVDDSFWEGLAPCCSQYEFDRLAEIADDGRLYVITNRKSPASAATKRWLNRFGIGHAILVHTKDKEEAVRQTGVDYFIDDRPRNCLQALDAGAKSFIMDWKYNRGFEHEKVIRVRSVTEYLRIIEAFTEGSHGG